MKRFFGLGMAIFSCLIVSCDSDTEKTKAFIPGYWAMESAFRDTRETTLLNDVYFQFEAGGTMVTNLPNTAEAPTVFELKDNIIVQKTDSPIKYNIVSITDSTLVLALNIRNTPFEFHLKKTSPPAPPQGVETDSIQ